MGRILKRINVLMSTGRLNQRDVSPCIQSQFSPQVCTIICSSSCQVGGRAVAYYMSTTVLAVILGIILVTAIRPGSAAVKGDDEEIQGV